MLLFSQIDDYLEQLNKEIDIPDSYYEKASSSYSSFTSWIDREDSTLLEFEPEIFLQGSFKLGTVIKPIGENGSYDIDIVCKFNNLSKQSITQKSLKELLGEEVQSYAKNKSMVYEPKNGKRCWTLNYHDEAKFHLDILPCVDDSKYFLEQLKILEYATTTSYKEKAVAITDKESEVYGEISDEWQISNPQGYFLWFRERSNFLERRAILAEKFQMNVEDLKEYKVKTLLQKTIQILKRHRDIMFQDTPEIKPSSVIISTLAARAYNGGDDLRYVLKYVIENMGTYVEEVHGEYRVLNPVNPLENFAHKWNKNYILKNHFDNWLKSARKNLTQYNESIEIYGDDFQNRISEHLGISESRAKDLINIDEAISAINAIPHRKKPQWAVRDLINVNIKATKTKSGFSYPKEFVSGDPNSKSVRLKFEAKAENIGKYEVYWQVTNTGAEAKSKDCLRGDFYDGEIVEGKRIRKEETVYVGTHIVEVYLVRNGICHGKSKPFIVNIIDGINLEW